MSSPRVRREEDAFATRVLSAFKRWLARVSDAVLRPVRDHGAFPDPLGIYSASGAWDTEVHHLLPELGQVARIGWSEVTQQATFSSTSFAIIQALDATENLLRNIPNEVHGMVTDEIGAGLRSGESVAQIGTRVQRLLSVTGNDHWRGRAQIIATTEVTRATNAGALAAAMAVEPNLGPMLKRWNDSDDERVRMTHRDVDGQEVPVHQPFDVGGFLMLYPADPTGPPHEVVSCRCDLSFRRADG